MAAPSMRVDGKVAIVTGSGSGLGRATAEALAAAGAKVVITELPDRMERAEAAAVQIRTEYRTEAIALPLDVTDVPGIRRMVQQAVEHFGRLDIMVNNAGINIARPALDVTEEDWDRVLDVDLRGVFFCAQAAGRQMITQGQGGKIINIASQNGVIAMPRRAAYCAAKAGVINLTRVLAIEWAPYRINVNAVGPTFVRTPLTEPTLSDPEMYEYIMQRIPLGRLATPDDVAAAVLFLASPAADMITGHTLLVDGGWTAQ